MNEETFDFKRGWPINPEAPDHSVEAKTSYIDNGTDLISPERYYSREWMEKEWDCLWSKVWTFAGPVSDIPGIGDYFTYELGHESFIVVRTDADTVKAFYNVCPHRGNRVVMNEMGSVADSFTCVFHSWQFNLDGTLKSVTDRETFREEVLSDEPGLTEVRCETWEGLVFITMSEDAPDLQDYLGILPEHVAPYNISEMKLIRHLYVEWPVNWKTALDVFTETYHVQGIHREVLPFLDEYASQLDLYEGGISRMLLKFAAPSPRCQDQTTITPELEDTLREGGLDPEGFEGSAHDVRPRIQEAKLERAEEYGLDYSMFTSNQLTDDWNYNVFPNTTMNLHPEGLNMQRLRPHPTDPEKYIYDTFLFANYVDVPGYQMPAYIRLAGGFDMSSDVRPPKRVITYGDDGYGPISDQDRDMLPFVQVGVKSHSFKGMRFSEQELRLRHFNKELDRYMDGKKW